MRHVESLEGRTLLSSDPLVDFYGRFLAVSGTAGNDRIEIFIQKNGGRTLSIVKANGKEYRFEGDPTGVFVNTAGGNDVIRFTALGVSALPITAYLKAGAGYDSVRICSDIKVNAHGEGGDDRLGIVGGFPICQHHSLFGDDGNDMLIGNCGDEAFHGGNGNDTIYACDGDDYLEGGEGNDRLDGGGGDDYLFGGAGADVLLGGGGNDELKMHLADRGVDWAYGGDGYDFFDVSNPCRFRKPQGIERFHRCAPGVCAVYG